MSASKPVTYTARCERVGDWWEVSVPELDEVTQARSLDEVPATVADLVALMTDTDPARVKVRVEADTGPGPGLGRVPWLALTAVGTIAAIAVRVIVRAAARVPAR